MTRLRLGAPPAPNWRERCSRDTPSRLARSGRRDRLLDPLDEDIPELALQRIGQPEQSGRVGQGACAATATSDTRRTNSPTTASSTPSTSTAATLCRRHTASMSPSSGRMGA